MSQLNDQLMKVLQVAAERLPPHLAEMLRSSVVFITDDNVIAIETADVTSDEDKAVILSAIARVIFPSIEIHRSGSLH